MFRLLFNRKNLGNWGERRCEKFLKNKGLKTLVRNFSCKTGEIDIVMADTDGSVVFVEVKTRSDETFTAAEDVITQAKKDKLAKTARYFLQTNNIKNRPCRFDVVTVVLDMNKKQQIKHYENAFTP